MWFEFPRVQRHLRCAASHQQRIPQYRLSTIFMHAIVLCRCPYISLEFSTRRRSVAAFSVFRQRLNAYTYIR
jgi:hypothetical protein